MAIHCSNDKNVVAKNTIFVQFIEPGLFMTQNYKFSFVATVANQFSNKQQDRHT